MCADPGQEPALRAHALVTHTMREKVTVGDQRERCAEDTTVRPTSLSVGPDLCVPARSAGLRLTVDLMVI